jgi:hypothetical protein
MNAGKLARGIVLSLGLGACGSAHKSATSSIMQPDGAMPGDIAPPIAVDAGTSSMNEKASPAGDTQRGPRAGDRGDGGDAGVDKPGRVGPDGKAPADGSAGMPGMPPPHAGEMAPPPAGMKPPHAGEKAPPPAGMKPPHAGEKAPPPPGMELPHAGEMAPPPHAGDHA